MHPKTADRWMDQIEARQAAPRPRRFPRGTWELAMGLAVIALAVMAYGAPNIIYKASVSQVRALCGNALVYAANPSGCDQAGTVGWVIILAGMCGLALAGLGVGLLARQRR